MNDLRFRLADDSDLATLVRLRDDAARWMLARGVTGQWRPGQLDGHKAGKPQPGGTSKSFTLMEKSCRITRRRRLRRERHTGGSSLTRRSGRPVA
ncbi:hypothetical protein [Actinocorallia aurantiaca]|uniref:Acetyltransferase (GNAT) family protein n=1 Tax=Actinocorallia aurantiaca TaxID=46204 RepID=A0ABN3UVS3_9ACTN